MDTPNPAPGPVGEPDDCGMSGPSRTELRPYKDADEYWDGREETEAQRVLDLASDIRRGLRVNPHEHQKIWFEHARQFTKNSTIYNSMPKQNPIDRMTPGFKFDTGVIRQTKLESLLETVLNIGTGFFVSWAVWVWVAAPLFGIPVHFAESLGLTTLFTVTSVARSYIWRRFFNASVHKRIHACLQRRAST